jgi:pimeloyl-ACP methyl ester carboxylesterase
LARDFWGPFTDELRALSGEDCPDCYALDLLGCGGCRPTGSAEQPLGAEPWAAQVRAFVETVAREPCVLVSAGGLAEIAVPAAAQLQSSSSAAGLAMLGPPPVPRLSTADNSEGGFARDVKWAIAKSAFGLALWRYLRQRDVLATFSEQQLFARPADDLWLDNLERDANESEKKRFGVLSFLCQMNPLNTRAALSSLVIPTLVVAGGGTDAVTVQNAVGGAQAETEGGKKGEDRCAQYRAVLPAVQTEVLFGARNVLAWEARPEPLSLKP